MRPSLFLPALLAALPGLALPGLARAEVPRVVTDMPVIQSLAAQVMGDLGTPEVLLDRGANAHSYQMKPSQARALQNADLLVWVGPEMTPWLERAAASAGPRAQIALLQAEGTLRTEFGADAHDHHDDHEDHDDHDDHAAEEDHGHAHDGVDPHAWLDPGNAATWLGAIAAELGRIDPANAGAYRANAEAAQARVAALDADVKAVLAPAHDRPFVTFHAAYGYFSGHYGLENGGALALGDATDPGAARLSDLRAELTGERVVCAFPEAGHDPRPIARLIEGTPVRLGDALDPEGAQLAPGAGLYDALMRDLAQKLRNCLAP